METPHNLPLLEVRNLSISFPTNQGRARVVDGVSLTLHRAHTVAIVGESGCGKTVTAMSIPRLLPTSALVESGEVLLYPRTPREALPGAVDLLELPENDLRRVRGGRVAVVFQEPLNALNPVLSVGDQIVEAVRLHLRSSKQDAWSRAVDLMKRVGIPDPGTRVRAFPHELSGGMRQRTMIAMALAGEPDVLIADEPTTALDVTVQAQVVELLREIQRERGLSILLVTHDLGVVAQMADDVYVMYAGRIVEHAPVQALFQRPAHPYTRALLRCTPRLSDARGVLGAIPGSVARHGGNDVGCRFAPRCELTRERSRDPRRATVLRGHGASPEEEKSDGGAPVLRRCVECFDDEPSGVPPLVEIESHHHVACWETSALNAPTRTNP